jgi:phosphopantothenoylcysteine decarboxylase/phosphopantothenate--cysteine ligase
MGFAVARRAAVRGHRVTLVTGPVALPDPPGVRVARVVSAADMAREVSRRFAACDAVVMTAAVADYAPARRARQKLKKTGRPLRLRLTPTRDILMGLGRRKGGRVLIGFALESSDELRRARQKLVRKNLDLIVANRPATLDARTIRAALLFPDGRSDRLPPMSKERFASRLVREVERACRGAARRGQASLRFGR